MIKKLFIFCACVLFVACQQEYLTNYMEESQPSVTVEDSTFVDVSLAKRVATTSNRHSSRSASSNVEEIITLSDVENKPWCYVVNYSDNKGYVMVSATKNYHPILMWSDNGNFDVNDMPEAAQFYIDGYRANIETLKNAPFDSIYRYRQEWIEYEEKPESKRVESRSLPTDVLYCMQQHEALWWSKGYQYSPIATNGLNLPTSVYENAVFMAELSMREDYMETSYIVRMEEVETVNVPQMLTTKWSQLYPANAKVQEYTGLTDPYVGCYPLAIAQVMKYYQYPTGNYNWASMPDVLTYYNHTEVARLLLEIGIATNTEYFENLALTKTDKALNYLRNNGYGNATEVSHNQFTVRSQLLLNKPVIMSGKPASNPSGTGHVWVCDGLDENNYKTAYYLMTILDTNPLSYLAKEIMVEDEWASRTFHLVWGEGGTTDGWFRDNEVVYNSVSHSADRKDIINIYKQAL